MKCIQFLILLFLILQNTHSQGFKNGFIVNNNQDTIHGLIADKSFESNLTTCVFREGSKSPKIKYSSDDLIYYEISDGFSYKTIEIFYKNDINRVFCKKIFDGLLDLYYCPLIDNTRFYVSKSNNELIGLSQHSLDVKSDEILTYSTSYIVKTQEYKDTLTNIMADCQKILPFIKYVEYNEEALIAIFKKYDSYMNNESVYVENKSFLSNYNVITGKKSRPMLGFYGGAKNHFLLTKGDQVEQSQTLTYLFGGFINYRFPMLYNHLGFNIGINSEIFNNTFYKYTLVSETDFSINNIEHTFAHSILNLPFSIKYYLSSGENSPYISMGIGNGLIMNSTVRYKNSIIQVDNSNTVFSFNYLLHKRKKGWFIDAGYEHTVNKINLYSNLRFEVNRMLIIEDEKNNEMSFKDAQRQSDYSIYIYNGIVNTLSVCISAGIYF